MEIVVNDSGPSKKTIKITIPAKEIQEKYDEQLKELKNNTVVPGFRVGKTPKRLLDRRFGKTILLELKRSFLAEGYEKAVEEHDVAPISEPEIREEDVELHKDKPCSIEIDVEVQPEFELPEYSGIKAEKDEVKVEDSEVEAVIDELRHRKAELVPVEEGASEEKDMLICNAKLKVAKEEIWSQENQTMPAMDTKMMGLEIKKEDLIGHKTGDVCKIKGKLPKDFKMEEYSGKKAELALEILDIKRIQLPELDDEFAKDLDAENVEELRKQLHAQIEAQKEHEANVKMETGILEQIVEQTKIDLPEKFLEDRLGKARQELKAQLTHEGKNEEEIAEEMKKEEENVQKSVSNTIKQFLIIDKIAKEEELKVSDEDLENHINTIASQQRKWPTEVRGFLEKHNLIGEVKSQLRQEKVLSLLREKADVS